MLSMSPFKYSLVLLYINYILHTEYIYIYTHTMGENLE